MLSLYYNFVKFPGSTATDNSQMDFSGAGPGGEGDDPETLRKRRLVKPRTTDEIFGYDIVLGDNPKPRDAREAMAIVKAILPRLKN